MIVISELMQAEGVQALEKAGLRVLYDPELGGRPDRLRRALSSASALIVRNQTQVNPALLEGLQSLRVVARLGVGLDNIDVEYLRSRNIALVWPRSSNAVAVAEYVLAALLFLSRRLDEASASVSRGEWDRRRFGGSELWNKTLGLLGLGDIGFRVARRARAFGMRVLATDPARYPSEAVIQEERIELVDLGTLLAESDFVSLHTPLLPSTRRLINRDTLGKMRPQACLINTARGELVDSRDLAEALQSGRLAGAVLDVVDQEPVPADHPLRGVANLWITPHVAGLTREADERVTRHVVEGIIQALGSEHAISS